VTRNVLVVEDEDDLRLMTRLMFQSRTQFNVIEASTGEQALKIIETEPIDVMLLDLRLPDMEGWEVLERLVDQGRFPALPVVMVSAHSTPSAASRQALERGVRGYVRKPFTAEELLAVVQNALGEELA
jgi:CheY-like chemotaxis protein